MTRTVSCNAGHFMNESGVYEDLQDVANLKTFMQTQLEDYNDTPGSVPMNLVLFQDAIEHGLYDVCCGNSTSVFSVFERVFCVSRY